MSYIPSPKQAEELVKQYNKEAFHIQHAETVSKVMGEFAKEYDPERVDFWRTDIDEEGIHGVICHGYGICIDVAPEKYMEKVLFATDELTGLIGAAALMRPTGLEGMEVKSVMKKFKDKKFAAGCSRDVIRQGPR